MDDPCYAAGEFGHDLRRVTPAATDSAQARQACTLCPLSGQFEFLIGFAVISMSARGARLWLPALAKAASRRASSFGRRLVFWLGSQVSNSYRACKMASSSGLRAMEQLLEQLAPTRRVEAAVPFGLRVAKLLHRSFDVGKLDARGTPRLAAAVLPGGHAVVFKLCLLGEVSCWTGAVSALECPGTGLSLAIPNQKLSGLRSSLLGPAEAQGRGVYP